MACATQPTRTISPRQVSKGDFSHCVQAGNDWDYTLWRQNKTERDRRKPFWK